MSRTRHTRLWSAVVLLVSLVLSACGGGAPGAPAAGNQQGTTAAPAAGNLQGTAAAPAASNEQSDATITISLGADPPSLDPAFSSALVDRMVHNSIYDKLVDLDKDAKVVPMLATEWKISDD